MIFWKREPESIMGFDEMINSLQNSLIYSKQALRFVSPEKKMQVEMRIHGSLEEFLEELESTIKDLKEFSQGFDDIDSELSMKVRKQWTKKIRGINQGVIQMIRFCGLQ